MTSPVPAPSSVPRARLAARAAGLVLVASLGLPGCTAGQREGQSSAYLIIESLQGASGARPTQFGGVLASDVLTFIKVSVGGQEVRVPTVFEDPGQVTFRLGLKDPGSPTSPSTPTSANFITVTRYRVTFLRSDGRNTPGVDVPYAFDGAFTVTVAEKPVTATLSLVRVQAKEEAPLRALVGGGGAVAISTIAEITFYGTDQAGRSVSVTGRISVNFADWGDPE